MGKDSSLKINKFRSILNLRVWGVSLVLGACGIHDKTIEGVDARSAALLSASRDAKAKGESIGWHKAADLLLERNPRIVQAKLQEERAKKTRKEYWKNYVPGIRGSASLAKNIGQFDELSLDDFNVYVFLNLRVPNPVTIRGELIGLSLLDYRSTRSYELTRRQQVVALYREFLRYEELRQEYAKDLKSEADEASGIQGEGIITRIRRTSRSSARRSMLLKSMNESSFRICQMLQIPDYKIRPRMENLPKIDYSKRYRQLGSKSGYGRLALQILATDIEGARLRHERVRIERWPRVSLGASAPQVYSSSSDAEFDVESVRLFGNLTKGFDILNDRKERIELSKREYEQVISDASYRMIREREMLRQAQNQYGELLKRKRSLNIALQVNRDLLRSGIGAERLLTAVEQRGQLSQQLKSINKSIGNQELEFWIWDESAWK